MFDELDQYTSDQFFLRPCDLLEQVCNAPNGKCGLFLIYALKDAASQLSYIGSTIKTKDNGCTGLFESIVNMPLVEHMPGKVFCQLKILEEDLEGLKIAWYETSHEADVAQLKTVLLEQYRQTYGQYPKWNKN